MLFPFPDRIRIDRGGGELGVCHPFLDHVQGHPILGRVDPKSLAQTLGATKRRIRDARLDHDPFHDLPDPDPAGIPDQHGRLPAGPLRLSDPVGGGQSIEKLGRNRDGSEHNFLLTREVAALLQRPDRNGAAGQVDPGWGDLEKLGRAAPRPLQGFKRGPIPGGLAPGCCEEGSALFNEIKSVPLGVMEAHFGHGKQNTQILLNMEAG